MEIRDIHKHAGWFASYIDTKQGKALVDCQSKKIKQLTELLEKIEGEIELTEEPTDYDEKIVLKSIKALIQQVYEVESVCGNYKWIG